MPINTAKKKIPLHRIAAASIFFDGRIVCVSPAINAVLQMIEPNAFPAAIAADPSNAAVVDTRISGRVVPRLTMVAPTTISGIPSFLAIATAASTNRSPPRQIRISPRINSKTVCIIFDILSLHRPFSLVVFPLMSVFISKYHTPQFICQPFPAAYE